MTDFYEQKLKKKIKSQNFRTFILKNSGDSDIKFKITSVIIITHNIYQLLVMDITTV